MKSREYQATPLHATLNGIMFQKMLRMVARIPKGRVATYGQIAKLAGYPGAARQVSWALHGSKGLPWHRVVGASGRILLTGDSALEQRMRLEMEGITFNNGKVDMKKFAWEAKSPSRSKRKKPRSH